MVRVRQLRGNPKKSKTTKEEETGNIKEPEAPMPMKQDHPNDSKQECNSQADASSNVNVNKDEQNEESSSSSIDYCVTFLRSLDWNRPLKRTTDMVPWVENDEWKHSFAHKYMNYEMEPNYVDLDNPLHDGPLIADLRKKESRRKGKKKDAAKTEFSVIKEGVSEVENSKPNETSDSEENFLDEFGNLKEDLSEASDEEATSDSAEVTPSTGENLGTNENKNGKKRKRQHKKHKKELRKKRKLSGDIKSVGMKGDIQEDVLKQSDKFFIDYDKAPTEKSEINKNSRSKPSSQNNSAMDGTRRTSETNLIAKFNFEEPHPSLLTKKEQQVYLSLMAKFRQVSQSDISLLAPIDKKDYDIFIQYRELVQEEQKEYQNWCKEVFVQQGDSDINSIPTDVRRYIDEYYEERLRRVPNQIPRQYVSINQFEDKRPNPANELLRLVPMVKEQSTTKTRFEMRFEKMICQLGSIPKIIIPKEKTIQHNKGKMMLPIKYEALCDKYPPSDTLSDTSKDTHMYKKSVTNDSNAQKLARIYKPDIVVSTSAIKTIFNNFGPNYERDWEIPITLWLIEDGRCVIFLDKPLPKKNMNILDKKKWYAKIASKSFLLHPRGKSKLAKDCDKAASESRDKRNFKTYDDLNLFQLDGMYDGASSSEEDKMVIDEGSQNEIAQDTPKPTTKVNKILPNQNTAQDEDSSSTEATVQLPFKLSADFQTRFKCDDQGMIKAETVVQDTQMNELTCQSSNDISALPKDENTSNVKISNETKCQDVTQTHCLANEASAGTHSKNKGNKNKLDEILHRTQKERYNRGRRSLNAAGRGRARQECVVNESDNKGNVLLDIMAAQEKTSLKTKTEPPHKTPEQIRKQLHEFNGITNPYAETGDVKTEYIPVAEDTNVNYSLWKLGKKAEPNPEQKIEKSIIDDSLRILVRSGIHGVRLETDANNQELYPQYYTVSCKVENQVEFGGEMMTKSELAKEWIATMLRPNSKLTRLRVNAATADVLMIENKNLKDLTNDGLKMGFRPDEALENLFTLFSELKNLPTPSEKENGTARYLLRHDSKTGAFVRILKSIEHSEIARFPCPSIVDIHAAYNIHSSEEAALPPLKSRWLPIDAELVTPYHDSNNKVPCLFSPKPFKDKNLRGRGRGRGRNSNKIGA